MDEHTSKRLPDIRVLVFACLVVVCVLVAVAYTLSAAQTRNTPRAFEQALDAPADPAIVADVVARPHLVFLHSPGGDAYRQVAVMPLDALDGPRYLTPLICQRVYMVASGGLCMGDGTTAMAFDGQFQTHGVKVAQPGIPTRARLSNTGALGAMTWFAVGHSYAESTFSTQTLLVKPSTGETVADLEQFKVFKDGAQFSAVDFNFWGVTFARDENQFYATLASGGRTYLVRGNVAQRTGTVLRENVECPSLSPDNTRLVFKKRVDPTTPGQWRLALLDLNTLEETMVAGEEHSVDDQVEWLDDQHIVYALPDEGPPATIAQDLWEASLDGSAPPRMVLKGALSPAVVQV